MKKINLIYALSLTALFFTSCSDDDNNSVDTTRPIIVLNEPGEHQEFLPGDEIHFDAYFSDNVELGSYKIEIHDASDGHSHERITNEEGVAWAYNETRQFDPGLRNQNVHSHIDIPVLINGEPIKEGHYHLGVFCTDKAGNQSQVFIEIVVGEDNH